MVRNRHRDRGVGISLLHDAVAAALPNLGEPMACEYPVDLGARKNAELT